MSKAYFIDFDETLLNTDKTVSEENVRALRDAQKRGDYLAFTTGRPFYGGSFLFKRLGISTYNCFLLCFHGALVYDLDRECIIHKTVMDKTNLVPLLEEINSRGIYLEAFSKDMLYCLEENDFTHRYAATTQEPFTVVDSIDEIVSHDIYKVMAIDYNSREELYKLQNKMENNSDNCFDSFFSNKWFYEFTEIGANKGEALRTLAKHLNLSISDTVAVGDEQNDISMIEAAGVGVAMINGKENVKAVADVITTNDNNHGGVAEILNLYK
ncbi:MAG: HAD family phosphatase [Lachnospiraceae bacterium]|nr:HAD family phosphatase [Lachnospiraceae bacterium]